MDLKVIDKDGKWFVNKAAFRMVDGDTGHIFESGVKYQIKETPWMKMQPMIVATSVEEEVDDVLVPHQTGDVIIGAAEGAEAADGEAAAGGEAASEKPAKKKS